MASNSLRQRHPARSARWHLRRRFCGEMFDPNRPDAACCSPRCRLQLHRARRRLYKDGYRDGQMAAYSMMKAILADDHGAGCNCRPCAAANKVRPWNTRPKRGATHGGIT